MDKQYTIKNQLKHSPGIYKISCSETDKIYIGETVDLGRRITKHFSLLRSNKHSNPVLQNIYNKYGENTFIVEVLEYLETIDDVELKTIEQQYQQQYSTCISFDSNEIYHIERNEEWVKHQTEILNTHREKMLDEFFRKPILVYDIIDKTFIHFKQISDCDLIEIKHISKNIKDKILIPYKHRYVAFLESEFKEEDLNNIICVNPDNIKYGAVRTLCSVYNLYENTEKKFASKVQFSYEFSKSKNDKLYDYMKDNKIIDFQFRSTFKPKNKNELYESTLILRESNKGAKCNFKIWYDALKSSSKIIKISENCNIGRKTVGNIFQYRDRDAWINMLEVVINQTPD